jgi:EpsI family protein
VGNGLRAAGVVLVAHRADASSAISVDHLTYSYLFTGFLLACLVGLAAMFGSARRGAPAGRETAAMPIAANGSGARIPLTAGAALLMVALPGLAAGPAGSCPAVPMLDPPRIVAPWQPVSPAADWRPAAAKADAELRHAYSGDGRAVDLYVGYYCSQRPGAEVVSETHRLTGGERWLVQSQGRDRLDAGAAKLPVQSIEVRSAGQRRLVAVWYWVDGRFTADPFAAKLLQAKAALLGGQASAAVIVASTPYDGDPSAARATLGQALVAMAPLEHVLMRPGGAAAPAAHD